MRRREALRLRTNNAQTHSDSSPHFTISEGKRLLINIFQVIMIDEIVIGVSRSVEEFYISLANGERVLKSVLNSTKLLFGTWNHLQQELFHIQNMFHKEHNESCSLSIMPF